MNHARHLIQSAWLVQSHSHSIVNGLSRVVWNPDSSRLFTVELKETEEMGWPLMVALLGEPLTPRMVADEREGRALAYPWREEGGGRGGRREGGREGEGEREGRNLVIFCSLVLSTYRSRHCAGDSALGSHEVDKSVTDRGTEREPVRQTDRQTDRQTRQTDTLVHGEGLPIIQVQITLCQTSTVQYYQ